MNKAEAFINTKLQERQLAGNYRALKPESDLIDFCSNDYLGFARSADLKAAINQELSNYPDMHTGATGSRLLAGNTVYAEELEAHISAINVILPD